ncbi:MAG TPA: sigma-70 family RNA polymerase sigma factor [Armatimonadota bacterium]
MALPSLHRATTWIRPAEDVRARFDALLSPLLLPLYRFARGMTHNAEDAEDLVQDAVVHAYRAFSSFRNGTNFKAWLFRICVNQYVDTYRSRQRAPMMLPLMDYDVNEDPNTPKSASPEEDLLQTVMDEELQHALAALPDSFRAVVLLSDMEGMPYDEIAHALAIPIGTVRSRLFRGRTQMRASLDGFARRRGLLEEGL